MATWQFGLFMVPEARMITVAGAGSQRITRAVYESVDWWRASQLPPNYQDVFSTLLPRAESWSADVDHWGASGESEIIVLHDGPAIEEVCFRIDVRSDYLALLERIAQTALWAQCLFVTEEFEVVHPDVSQLISEVENSSARRFVLDPQAFLDTGENV
jgi:hypothetical protein